MGIPLGILSFASIFSGYFLKKWFVGSEKSEGFFEGTIFVLNENSVILESAEFLPLYIKIIPTVFSLVGLFLALFFYSN
jgi:NADH:ubiquinone oxidoreductase subunit 5 (subunit L)/multisubunit Na+/H+ antiporter MnhA subunit